MIQNGKKQKEFLKSLVRDNRFPLNAENFSDNEAEILQAIWDNHTRIEIIQVMRDEKQAMKIRNMIGEVN